MDNDEIIRMAREAGLIWKRENSGIDVVRHSFTQIERFAALVAAAEREKIATWAEGTTFGGEYLAEAIREMGM